MIFSKKLRQLRSASGLSQEQLAERLGVTRQVVVKWETGNGMPDIDNLQQLADVFGVSLDELMDYKNATLLSAVRDNVQQQEFSNGWQDDVVRSKFPKANITQLVRAAQLSWWQNVLEVLTVGAGATEMFDTLNTAMKDFYYLVEMGDRQWLVVVTKVYVESRELTKPFSGKRMVIDGQRYTKVRELTQ